MIDIKIYIIVHSDSYRFVDVKKTKQEANKLVRELKELNTSVGVPAEYEVIEKEL